jgi:hypothetical protein
MPNGVDLSLYGAKKTILKKQDEQPIIIDLFNGGKKICTLNSVYYTKDTLEKICKEVDKKVRVILCL